MGLKRTWEDARRGVLLLSIVEVVALGLVVWWTQPRASIVLFGGQQSASVRLDDGTTVTIQVASNRSALFDTTAERRLVLCRDTSTPCGSLWLGIIMDNDLTQEVALYRRVDGSPVAVHWLYMVDMAGAEPRAFGFEEELAARLSEAVPGCLEEPVEPAPGDPPPSRYFRDLSYVGVFDWAEEDTPLGRGQTFRFMSHNERGEELCAWPSRG